MSYTIVLRLIGLVSVLAIAGCEVKTYTDTVPVAGGLHTPEGLVPFKRVTSEKLAKKLKLHLLFYTGATHSPIYAEGKNSQVIFNPQYPFDTLQIITFKKDAILLLDINNAFYQVDGKEKKPWPIREKYKLSRGGRYLYEDTRRKYYSEKIKAPLVFETDKKYDHTFSYHLPYTLNNEDYLIDITVKYEKNYELELDFGFPGSP
jgi:hypothetical protein